MTRPRGILGTALDDKLGAFDRLVRWKPPRSFEQDRGEDMISGVWELRNTPLLCLRRET